MCRVVKLAEEELEFLTGTADLTAGVARLRAEFPNLELILVTLGRDGSMAFYRELAVQRPTYLQVEAVDTTGAGDTFMGCCLHALLDRGRDGLDEGALGEMLDFANAAASLITTRKGALLQMPGPEEIAALMAQGSHDA